MSERAGEKCIKAFPIKITWERKKLLQGAAKHVKLNEAGNNHGMEATHDQK